MEWTPETITVAAGIKRCADNDLYAEQPLSKRLEKLSIWAPLPAQSLNAATGKANSNATLGITNSIGGDGNGEERMDVDNVVYIASIDDELSDDEKDIDESTEKKKLVFISDIEREMTRIPHHVLKAGGSGGNTDGLNGLETGGGGTSTDLVLYSVPKTLSVTEEKDNVRKAILETRERLRLKRDAAAAVEVEVAANQKTIELGGSSRWEEPSMNHDTGDDGRAGLSFGTGGLSSFTGDTFSQDDDHDAMDIE